ncbi:hypothetical protein [Sporosarcina cascadiensis]|uniref:hypothetical protein n=1 Tax=Sporosarcina cascadiensis TaxID=2660747 RepID=UPI00129B9EE5|nr:hypothetical protein [Sporosarcina cascadiensis]
MLKLINSAILSSLVLCSLVGCNSENVIKEKEEIVPASHNELDSVEVDTEPVSKPVYSEEELKADPKAPSKNQKDYNEDGEFVPENGPTNNPADYNYQGEYKPVDQMTKEEIEKELLDMLGR